MSGWFPQQKALTDLLVLFTNAVQPQNTDQQAIQDVRYNKILVIIIQKEDYYIYILYHHFIQLIFLIITIKKKNRN